MLEKVFNYHDKKVRTINKDSEIWFVAKDICDILEISNSRDAIQKLDDDEKGVAKSDTLGGNQDVNLINESGLYNLIFRSNKSVAKTFKRWVTHEVLPSIRKTGGYTISPQQSLDFANILAITPANRTDLVKEILRQGGFDIDSTQNQILQELKKFFKKYEEFENKQDFTLEKVFEFLTASRVNEKKFTRNLFILNHIFRSEIN